jgi:hypothetical protein
MAVMKTYTREEKKLSGPLKKDSEKLLTVVNLVSCMRRETSTSEDVKRLYKI